MSNIVDINEVKSSFFPYLAFILSLLLIYSNDSLIIFSTSILISIFVLGVYFIHGRLLVGIDFFVVLSLFGLSIFLLEKHGVKEILRVIYIYGGFSLAFYYRNLSRALPLKNVYLILLSIFLLDLLLRVFVSSDLQSYSVYAIKAGGGLYSDSNYSGLLLVVVMSELVEKYKEKLNLPIFLMLLLLLLTFSRTAFLMLIFFGIAKRFKKIAIFVVLLLFFLLVQLALISQPANLDLAALDGSLNTKYLILQSFGELMREDLDGLLFGLGRANEQVLDTYGYTGHTFFGQIVQFGVIQVLVIAFLLRKYLIKYSTNPDALFLTIFFGGMFSFFPSSYIGLIVLITAVIKFSRVSI